MLRTVGAVVGGYFVMALVMFLAFTAAYVAMGADRAFAPNSYDVSGLWLVVWFVVSLGTAVIGGWVARKIAPASKAPLALAVLVLILGGAMAIPALTAAKPTKERTSETPAIEAMTSAYQPPWTAIANPIIGFAGVMIGGRGGRKP